jgi:hypothetical protein
MVMEGVRDLPGAGAGTFRDGGLLDYHLDLPYSGDDIVLYPHFTDRVIPGWFDKTLPWRRACPARLQNVLLLAPSRNTCRVCPTANCRIVMTSNASWAMPRAGRNTGARRWMKAVALGDEFLGLAANGRLGERLLTL